MDDDFNAELSKILQEGSREGDEEALLRLTKRMNEILLEQDEQQRQSSESGNAEYWQKTRPFSLPYMAETKEVMHSAKRW